ncbi:hypothetical protein BAURA86_02503 [Brevibacterium aurantiacum]|uniref:Uncharacterized protein n=1 Tax=Brevibacterium aurantiacum TaxID=273384 RepID=A0A2H1K7T5_BREAU|nr:hypothetical protein BAURA86_02503 [Brevibacterium aurantiacum]
MDSAAAVTGHFVDIGVNEVDLDKATGVLESAFDEFGQILAVEPARKIEVVPPSGTHRIFMAEDPVPFHQCG